MSSLRRTIKREIMFNGMNAKQKKLRRAERKNARENTKSRIRTACKRHSAYFAAGGLSSGDNVRIDLGL